MTFTHLSQLLAGLGLFLYGMFLVEDSLKKVEGRAFKLFLRKNTKTKLGAIFSGTFITGILQSSSIVNLLVLSFVGAGMLNMRNALGVVLGANLGGTLNSWLLALFGFKMNLSNFSLPAIGIAGIGLIIFKNNSRLNKIFKFCMGIGLLFLGLDYMKLSMDSLMNSFDFRPYLNYPRIGFVMIGFIITALIQTSSATVVIVLTALYAKIIPIETAVAVVLGAELGTTIKILIGSIGGIAAKKRVAFGNILFNIVTSIFGFICLIPIINIITDVFGITDPLLILVSFQTLINLVGIVLFYFFLNGFGTFLERRFKDDNSMATYYLQNTSPKIIDTAHEMLEKEVNLFIYQVIKLNMTVFEINIEDKLIHKFEKYELKSKVKFLSKSFSEKYNLIKQAEGEIITFYAKMGEETMEKQTLIKVNQLITAVRSAMYSAKGMKDIYQDSHEFSKSGNDYKFNLYKLFHNQLTEFYNDINEVFINPNKSNCYQKLIKILANVEQDFKERMNNSYKNVGNHNLKELDISTLFNINRELYSSSKAIILALKDYLLDIENAEKFETIPSFNLK